jgi:hypothetical protein
MWEMRCQAGTDRNSVCNNNLLYVSTGPCIVACVRRYQVYDVKSDSVDVTDQSESDKMKFVADP